MGVNLGLSL